MRCLVTARSGLYAIGGLTGARDRGTCSAVKWTRHPGGNRASGKTKGAASTDSTESASSSQWIEDFFRHDVDLAQHLGVQRQIGCCENIIELTFVRGADD